MNVAIFGASGATGILLTERCLAAGYDVTALVRTPANFIFRDRVRMVEGSAFDPAAVRQTVEGADVVLRLWAHVAQERGCAGARRPADRLGHAADRRPPDHRARFRRSPAGFANKQPAWRRWFVQNIVYNTFLKWPVASQISQWKTLSASDLDWTMVMPPMLTNTRRGASIAWTAMLCRRTARVSPAET